jgi:hypothetical protein
MILPSKHLSPGRSILTLGSRLLIIIDKPKTISSIWNEINNPEGQYREHIPNLGFDMVILALDFLFLIGAINMEEGRIARERK